MGPNWQEVWMALNDPSLIDKQDYDEVKGWKRDQEKWFQDMHVRGRPKMQEATRTLPSAERRRFISSFAGVIRLYSQRTEFLRRTVSELILRSGANIKVDEGLTETVIKHSEHWRFFLASMAYGMPMECMGGPWPDQLQQKEKPWQRGYTTGHLPDHL